MSNETHAGITVVYRNENGFVTDFGRPLQLVGSPNLNDITDIPQYGVWKMGPRKWEVFITTNSLEDAKAALGAEDKPIPRHLPYLGTVHGKTESLGIFLQRRIRERRRKTSPEEQAELEKMAGRALPTDHDVDQYLFTQREDAMRDREFVERGGDRRKS